ncbi:NAD(P)-dependent oxidoreductase [Bdellovibrio bacteriovorus]|uniref:NAD(P)-dependent oxidoreductase n=1 Tax=Bdellovibrio bacteriovorus TaxID=959 RepID=A0A162GAC4_BDEBC|nr:SDR family oxidoreductase [Bdellovibrio bacteriovorus]KYG65431.1 NAD(P)-dependent oxidoreductase [Bdellovibrio bacteriovorus]
MGLRVMITGPTGTLGQELVRKFKRAGLPFVAASRSLDRLPEGVRGLQLDYGNSLILEQAFRDVDVLFFLQPLASGMREEALRVIKAARKSGVEYILKISEIGASAESPYLYQRLHGEIDDLLKHSGIPYALLKPSSYMQNFIHGYGEALLQGTLFLPEGEGRTAYVDARDVADVALEILKKPWDYEQKSLDVTGARALSNSEAMALLSNQIRRRISYVPVTEEAVLKTWQRSGMDKFQMEVRLSLHRAVREGRTHQVSIIYQSIMGREPVSFEQFCHEMKDFWLPRREDTELWR